MTALRDLSDRDLSSALTLIGRELELPVTPVVIDGVRARVADRERTPVTLRPRLSLPSRRRTIALVAAAVLLLGGAAFAAKVVIDLGAVTIDVVPSRPIALPTTVETGRAFGRPSTLGAAEAEAGFTASIPAALGAPDHVWVGKTAALGPPTSRVVLAWDPRPDLPAIDRLPWGAVLMELRGDAAMIGKTVFADAGTLDVVHVDGDVAYWITGVHTLTIVTPYGTRDLRITGNVLVWQRGGLTYRMEIAASRDRAVAIAESLP
jgi:hypothetical protein